MLIYNTVLLSPDPIAKNDNSSIALSDYSFMLLSNGYQGIIASALQQIGSDRELLNSIKLSTEEYAATQITSDQVAIYQLEHPDASFQEAALSLANQQLEILKVAATSAMPKLKIDSGTISSRLYFQFSQTQNSNITGSLFPRMEVRPPSLRSNIGCACTLTGEMTFNFKIEEK